MRAAKGSFSVRGVIPSTGIALTQCHFDSTFSAKYVQMSKGPNHSGPVFRCTLKSLSVSDNYFTDYMDKLSFGFLMHPFFLGTADGNAVEQASEITYPLTINIVVPSVKFPKVEDYDPTNTTHQTVAKSILLNNIGKNPEALNRIKPLFEKSIRKANKKATRILERLVLEKSNDEIRKQHHRENCSYHTSTAILKSLFFGSRASESASTIFVDTRTNNFVFPSDKLPTAYGFRTKVLTFGTQPYPFAVVLVYESEPFGVGDALTRQEQLVVVANIKGKLVAAPVNVAYKAPEDQLELVALMTVSSELQKEKSLVLKN